jgi:hypothetical protein
MSIKFKLSETWRSVISGYAKVNGAWRKLDILYTKENGSWRVVAKRVPDVTQIAYTTAEATLTALGFTVTKVNTNSSDSTYNGFSGGKVQTQVPAVDELQDAGGAVILNTITYEVSAPSFGPYFYQPPSGGGPVVPGGTPTPEPFVPVPTFTPIPSFYPGFFVPSGAGLIGYAYVSPPGPYVNPGFSPNPSFAPATVAPFFSANLFTGFGQTPTFGGGGGAGFGGTQCVLGTTKLQTTKGFIYASDLEVGNILLSVDVEEIDTEEEKLNFNYWLSGTFTIKNLTTTTVTRVTKQVVTDLIIINGESYSFEHAILVERDNEYEFIRAQFIKETDKVLRLNTATDPMFEFVAIDSLTRVHHREGIEVYDIGVEPYDVYFTDGLLSHNK